MTHSGSCFCGDVRFEVTGEPVAMGYCHCSSCRHWSAGPVNAFTLWNPGALEVTQGDASIGTYNKTLRALASGAKNAAAICSPTIPASVSWMSTPPCCRSCASSRAFT